VTRRRSSVDEYGFDLLDDETDELSDGFIVTDENGQWESDDNPFCDFGFGDDEGLCIKHLYGCHYVGCEMSDAPLV